MKASADEIIIRVQDKSGKRNSKRHSKRDHEPEVVLVDSKPVSGA
jgi:hypothetical protein